MYKIIFFLKRAWSDIFSPNRFGISNDFLKFEGDFCYALDYTTDGMKDAYSMKFDENGIIMMSHYIDDKNAGSHYYSPVKIAHYALGSYNDYQRTSSDQSLVDFNNHVQWLKDNTSTLNLDSRECLVWKTPSTNPKYKLGFNYISAIVQGLVISALTRAFKLNNDQESLELSIKATDILSVPVEEGGLLSNSEWGPMYEEYPALPYSHVINGFMFCLMGLYDLKTAASNNARLNALFAEGMKTLHKVIPSWVTADWSKYDLWDITNKKEENLATRHYQFLHVDQLKILHEMTGSKLLSNTALKLESQAENIFYSFVIYYNKFRKLILKR